MSVSFLIPATYGERVGFVITTQLAVTFIMSTVEQQAAPSGDLNSPKLYAFVRYVTFLCIISLIDTLFFLHQTAETGKVMLAPWLRNEF